MKKNMFKGAIMGLDLLGSFNFRTLELMEATKLRYKRLLSLILIGVGLSSCSITGLTDGFSKLSTEEKSLVSYSSKETGGETPLIRMVNGQELRSVLEEGKTNVVYSYTYYCVSDRCYPVSSVRNALPEHCNLYVVARVLAPVVLQLAKDYKVYGIDKYYYKSRYLFRYEDRFFDELTGRTTSDQDTKHI